MNQKKNRDLQSTAIEFKTFEPDGSNRKLSCSFFDEDKKLVGVFQVRFGDKLSFSVTPCKTEETIQHDTSTYGKIWTVRKSSGGRFKVQLNGDLLMSKSYLKGGDCEGWGKRIMYFNLNGKTYPGDPVVFEWRTKPIGK